MSVSRPLFPVFLDTLYKDYNSDSVKMKKSTKLSPSSEVFKKNEFIEKKLLNLYLREIHSIHGLI